MKSAFIVANSEYSDPKLRKLRAPSYDAEALVRVLANPAIGGFEVEVSQDEPEYKLRRRLATFFDNRSRDDLLLVHFSCHGVKDDDGTLYFATADTDVGHLDVTSVSSDFVNRHMSRSRSRRIALFLDCCYSGAFSRGARVRAGEGVDLAERFGGRGQVVITASNAMEYAFEGDELIGEARPSIFTTALVEGLETGAADRDGDGLISVDELYDYVYERVREAMPNQTPSKWMYELQGDLHIAQNPRPDAIQPGQLPSELVEATQNSIAAVREGAVQELERLLRGNHRAMALAAKGALEALAEDDSKRVSERATAALAGTTVELVHGGHHLAETEPVGRPAPSRASVGRPAPRHVDAPRPSPRQTPGSARGRASAWTYAIRALPVALMTLVGAGVGLVANVFSHIQGQPAIGTLAAYTPETIGVPVLAAGVALLLAFGRIREQFAYGLLLGFGLLTLTGGIGMAVIQSEFNAQLGGAPFVFLAGGAVILAAALVGVLDAARVHTPPGGPFRWGTASILAATGAAILVPGLFVPLGRLEEDGSDVSLSQYGHYGFSGSALEPAVAIAAAIAAAYALGRGGARRLLAAGVTLALGVQIALMLGTWLGSIITEYFVKPELRVGWLVGIAAAALLVAAGLVGRRSPEDQAEKPPGAVVRY